MNLKTITQRLTNINAYCSDVDSFISDLQRQKNYYISQGFSKLDIRIEQEDYGDSWYLYLYGERPETESEKNKREKEELRYKECRRKHYLELKKEFDESIAEG